MDKKLGKNVILSMGYKLLTIIVPFLTAPYLARVLGADALGSYTYAQSIASYFVMFAILGIQTYGNRTIAKVRDDRKQRSKVFWQLYFMQLTMGIIVLSSYALFVFLFFTEHRLLLIIVSLYVLSSLFAIDWFCEGMEFFSSIALRTLCIKAFNLICIFVFVKDSDAVVKYCLIMSLGYLLSSLSLWPTLIKNVGFIKPSNTEVIQHIKTNIVLFLPTFD